MDILPDPQFWGRLLEISFLNLLLSGDNAVVIALAVRALPLRMRLLGQIWGTVGAVALRLLFVGIVTALLQIPLLRLVGSLLLLWIAVRLIRPNEEAARAGRHGASFWESVWIIIVADITMSLDNVLAVAAAAHGNMPLILIGIGMSIPIVIGGSRSDFPVLEKACAVLAELDVPSELRVVSAHRTPAWMSRYAGSAAERGLRVIIAGAGGAAHLPGMVAAQTVLPVIGVPIPLGQLDGLDSLLSIVQMPRGVPVATVAIGNAENAALLAARIVALTDPAVAAALTAYRERQAAVVMEDPSNSA